VIIDFNSDGGRIGPFWWLNASTAKTEMHNATYSGSLHYVWREGVSGWGSCIGKRFFWRTIK
jgi:hypothetical protein